MGNIVTTFVFGGAVEQACSLQKWCHNAEVLRKHLAFQKQIVVRTVVLTNRVPEVSNLCPRADVRGFDPRLTAAIARYNRGVRPIHEVTCPATPNPNPNPNPTPNPNPNPNPNQVLSLVEATFEKPCVQPLTLQLGRKEQRSTLSTPRLTPSPAAHAPLTPTRCSIEAPPLAQGDGP